MVQKILFHMCFSFHVSPNAVHDHIQNLQTHNHSKQARTINTTSFTLLVTSANSSSKNIGFSLSKGSMPCLK